MLCFDIIQTIAQINNLLIVYQCLLNCLFQWIYFWYANESADSIVSNKSWLSGYKIIKKNPIRKHIARYVFYLFDFMVYQEGPDKSSCLGKSRSRPSLKTKIFSYNFSIVHFQSSNTSQRRNRTHIFNFLHPSVWKVLRSDQKIELSLFRTY